MPLLSVYSVPNSTRILVGSLTLITSLIFLIKLSHYRQAIDPHLKFHDLQVPYLQLIPRYTIFYPWAIVTAIFAEISVVAYVFSATILVVSSRYIERFWGFKEVVKFVVVVGSITNFCTVLITIVSNIVRQDGLGMDKPLGGGISYYFGFLVVLKQLIPEHNIVLFQGLLNFRVKNLPFVFVVVMLVWSLFISRSLYPFVPSLESFTISFTYLRFYQTFALDPILPLSMDDSGNIVRGDASDSFKFVEFFPNITKPYLGVMFDKLYEICVLLGIVVPFNDESIDQGNRRAQKRLEQINQTQKSVASSVAERRRQVALQVIEDRIVRETRT